MYVSLIEKAEIQTLTSRLNAIQSIEGNPMGVHQLVKGSTNAFVVENIPGPAFNTVRGLNEKDLLCIEDIFRFYNDYSSSFLIEITPSNSSDLLFRTLTENGYYQSDFHASFIGETSEFKKRDDELDITVRSLKKEEFDLFASIYVDGFGLPPSILNGIKENNEILFDVPGWQFYVAYVKDAPVGVAVLFVHDEIATLAAAATLPEYRRMGVQSALLHKRLQVAVEKGVKYVTSEAAFGSTSHRNMERAGLKLAYTKALWRRL